MDADLKEMGLWDAYYGRPRQELEDVSSQATYDDAYANEMEVHS